MKRPLLALYRATFRFASPWIRNRSEIPFLLNALGLTGEAAEVGVELARYSKILLLHWKGRRLYSIDPWHDLDVTRYDGVAARDQATQDYIFREATARLAAFGDRSVVVRETSVDAARRFRDGQLDFVYLDAQHQYEAVVEDLTQWRPKVKPGGIFAGHDYFDADTDMVRFGVRSAVDELARREGRRVLVTREREAPSWLIRL